MRKTPPRHRSCAEESHLKLMLALAEVGERVAALRQYEICRDTLRTELDAMPGDAIEALRSRLLKGTMNGTRRTARRRSARSTRCLIRPRRPRDRIGLCGNLNRRCPFDCRLAIRHNGRRLAQDFLRRLDRRHHLRLGADQSHPGGRRNTMLAYKHRVIDIRAIGREVGVNYVLEGSVRKSATRPASPLS